MSGDLEARIKKLEILVENAFKVLECDQERLRILDKHDELTGKMLLDLKAMIDAHTMQIGPLQLDMMKMCDAYYQVFPERLEQDDRVTQQLDAITSARLADVPEKKP